MGYVCALSRPCLQASRKETVEAILSDLSTLAVVPLLQTSLFTS